MSKRIEKLFKGFNTINQICNTKLIEISVKQRQITFIYDDSLVFFSDFSDFFYGINQKTAEESYVTFYDEKLHITFGGLELDNMEKGNVFKPFLETIKEFADNICTCPSLEFVISELYIKCFLDKPNLGVSDLKKYEDILEAEGGLELHPQRPYLLFVNEGEFTDVR